MTVQEPPAVTCRPDKLMSFVFRAVDEVGATLNTALVVMGDKLGFYTALSQAGPLTPCELAAKTGTSERYVREWLNAQAAGGYVEYQPDDGRYTLPPEQAVALTDGRALRISPGSFRSHSARSWTHRESPKRRDPAPASAGMTTCMTCTKAASGSSDPATTPTWSQSGSRRSMGSSKSSSGEQRWPTWAADMAASTVLMAAASPRPLSSARIITKDRSRRRVQGPRKRMSADRVTFEVAPAASYPGRTMT